MGVALTMMSDPRPVGGQCPSARSTQPGHVEASSAASSAAASGAPRSDRDRVGAGVGQRDDDGPACTTRTEDQAGGPGSVEAARDTLAVGARRNNDPVVHDERVGGGGASRRGLDHIAVLDNGLLVRNRDVGAGEAEGAQPCERIGHPILANGQRDVGPIEFEARERGVVHRRRERVADRRADDSDQTRRSLNCDSKVV